MSCCEKCWGDAYMTSINTHRSQSECYHEILEERNATQTACSPKEQAGQWWDEEKQKDSREDSNG